MVYKAATITEGNPMNTKFSSMSKVELAQAIRNGEIPPGTNLQWANLGWTALDGANLVGADLRGAKLVGAHLHDANLCSADLTGADLGGADLFGACLAGACLAGANLAGAILPDGTIYESETSSVWGPVLDENGDPIKFIEVSITRAGKRWESIRPDI